MVPPDVVPAGDLLTPMKSDAISIDDALKRRLRILHRRARNLILIVPEGITPSTLKIARDVLSAGNRPLEIDRFPVTGRATINVPGGHFLDSKGGAAVLVTGRPEALQASSAQKPMDTLFSVARARGLRIGLVSDSPFNEPVIGSFLSSGRAADFPRESPRPVLESEAHVLMGAGRSLSFGQEAPIDFLKLAKESGFTTIDTRKALVEAVSQKPSRLMGLFGETRLPWSWEPGRETTPAFPDMVAAALNLLRTGEQGFILVVHSARIREAQNRHDPAQMLDALRSLEESIKVLTDFTQFNQGTLAVLVPFPTGTDFSFSANYSPAALTQLSASTALSAHRIRTRGGKAHDVLPREYPGLSFTPTELADVSNVRNTDSLELAIGSLVSTKLGILFRSASSRTSPPSLPEVFAGDLFIHAVGSHQSLFGGVLELADIPKRMAATLGWEFP
jgi:alkaline phosphatase